jgi:hypothetical protein
LYSTLNTIRQVKSKRKRWAVHVARIRVERKTYKVLVGNPKEIDHLADQGVHGRVES